MTPRERLYARLKGNEVDKIPNLNIVMLFAAKYAGVKYGEFCRDYRKLVFAQMKTAEDFGLDILSVMSDPNREVADYGAEVTFVEDDLPVCREILVKEVEELSKIKKWDPLKSERMLDRIKAVQLFRELKGMEYPILGWVEGPFAEFTDLTGVSDGMLMLFDEPEAVEEAMEIIASQALDCAKAQIDAGADIIGMGDAAVSLVSREIFQEFIFPLEQKIVQGIHEYGGLVKLHICGNTNHILELMIETGADIIDIDYLTDYKTAIHMAAGKCSICGNFDPTSVLLQGNRGDVIEAVKSCIDQGDRTSLVSAGCEVPKMTPVENLKAVESVLCSKRIEI